MSVESHDVLIPNQRGRIDLGDKWSLKPMVGKHMEARREQKGLEQSESFKRCLCLNKKRRIKLRGHQLDVLAPYFVPGLAITCQKVSPPPPNRDAELSRRAAAAAGWRLHANGLQTSLKTRKPSRLNNSVVGGGDGDGGGLSLGIREPSLWRRRRERRGKPDRRKFPSEKSGEMDRSI